MLKNINKYSQILTQSADKGAAQAMLYALGLSKQDMDKAQIGIGSMWYEGNPCNAKLDKLALNVKNSIQTKNLLGMRFNTIGVSDGMSMGTSSMRYSLPSRELITDSIETIMQAQHYDGLVCISGCDKNLPASAMALTRLNRPGFIIYGGSMKPAYYNKNKLDIVSAFESYGKYLKGDISKKENQLIIENACDKGCGSCSGLYTANTMATLFETMGLTLPNSSSNIANSYEKFEECKLAGDVLENLLVNDIKPLDIITKKSLMNAIKMLYISGGSTNGVIHLLAIAKTAKVNLTLKDFESLQNIPVLLNMKPHGSNVMYDLYKLGGTRLIIKYLIDIGILDGSCLTITGKSLRENTFDIDKINFKQNIILPVEKPFKKNSHIKILHGNLAPNGCVAKINSNYTKFKGKALIFNSEKEMLNSLKNNEISKDNFIIIRYQGESIGCPEMLSPTSALIGYFGDAVPPLATDGRFSGGSKGILIAHLPDAYKENSITRYIKNNDIVELDLEKNLINIKSDFNNNKFKEYPEIDGYLKKYSKLVSNINNGYLT